jgi:hypothetical protein
MKIYMRFCAHLEINSVDIFGAKLFSLSVVEENETQII